MKILFYDTKKYDEKSFSEQLPNYPDIEITFLKEDLDVHSALLSKGYTAICIFVSSDVSAPIINTLSLCGVRLILLRCAGFNNVDLSAAALHNIRVMRVSGYSPEAVAEHAMALALSANRKIHKAYVRVRENDFSLNGLIGFNFYGKKAGIVGTGKIGLSMARICHGFGMDILGYDVHKREDLPQYINYVSLDYLFTHSDLISLHCPLTEDTYHLINKDTINLMKNGTILVNTSRGALVNTNDLIDGIRAKKFFGVGLDVYEEESENVFEDRSDEILSHSTTARLLSFPNVVISSHQGFFTKEALLAIATTTLDNAMDYINDLSSCNDVVWFIYFVKMFY